jgi:hypothetical protein
MSDTNDMTLEPDAAMMRRHVGHLFEGWLDGCQDGKIELAWTDGRDGRLRHADIFGTDQLDELVAKAVHENSKEGQNVYIGQALRKPGHCAVRPLQGRGFPCADGVLHRHR